jgi:DNA-binding response OmpR family regulator
MDGFFTKPFSLQRLADTIRLIDEKNQSDDAKLAGDSKLPANSTEV